MEGKRSRKAQVVMKSGAGGGVITEGFLEEVTSSLALRSVGQIAVNQADKGKSISVGGSSSSRSYTRDELRVVATQQRSQRGRSKGTVGQHERRGW